MTTTPKGQIHVRPARAGELIRDPHTRRALPAEGGHVPDDTFWRRRLDGGDVVLVEEAPHAHVDRMAAELAAIAHDAAHVAYEGRELPGHVDRVAGAHEGGERPGTLVPTGLEPVTPLTTREGGK